MNETLKYKNFEMKYVDLDQVAQHLAQGWVLRDCLFDNAHKSHYNVIMVREIKENDNES